jgi:hypothetical protein
MSLNDGGLISDSNTKFKDFEINNVSLYEKRNEVLGKVFIRNNFHNSIYNIVDALSSVFIKYPDNIVKEIEDKVIKFFVIDNVFVVETENYVASDSYIYDINLNSFKNTNTKPFYKKKVGIDKYLDSFINPWYDEKYKRLFLVFINTLENSLSSSNYKYIVPEIYSTNTSNIDYEKIYPLVESDTNIYSLSTFYGDIPEINLIEYSGGSFRKNSLLDEFNLTYMVKNLNSIPFIVNEKLYYQSENNTFSTTNPLLLKPFYYILDNNYANPEMRYYVRSISNRSGYTGLKESQHLDIVNVEKNKTNYAFASNVEVLQINQTGRYIIELDWETYRDTNIFVGCSALNVKPILNDLIINFKSNSFYVSGENKKYHVFDFETDNRTFSVSAEKPVIDDNEILILDVESTNSQEFSGTFCGDSIYRKLKIIKAGFGEGEVTTEPACINCGTSCEYLYPLNSTITLVASAAPRSIFAFWSGDSECFGKSGDCVFTLDDDKTIIANFEKLPLVRLSIDSGIGNVASLDGIVNCDDYCAYDYTIKTYITLSASPPPFGFKFERFTNIPCYEGNRVCTFIIYNDVDVQALYSPIIYYNLTLSIQSQALGENILTINTEVGEYEITTSDTEKSILINEEPKGSIIWKYDDSELNTVVDTTSNSLSEKSIVSMSAIPFDESYIFRKWIGGPCDGSDNNICIFELNQNENIIAYFDLAPFTITIVTSGGGIGLTYSTPDGINFIPFSPDSVSQFEFTSGQEITLFSEAFEGSQYIGMFSDDVPSTTLNTTTFILTSNVTLTAVYLPFIEYTFELFKYGENRVSFTTNPPSDINCGFSCISASDEFVSQTNIVLTPEFAANSKILYYKTSVPIVNSYIFGNGLISSEPTVNILSDQQGLVLANASLILNDQTLGAPYAQNFGINISYNELSHIITSDISVSAFLALEGQIEPTPTPTPTPNITPSKTPTSTPNVTPTPTPTQVSLWVLTGGIWNDSYNWNDSETWSY